MGRIIIPKTYVKDIKAPLIFLAGPIGSAPNWQDEAIDFLLSKDSDLIIASPRREIRDNLFHPSFKEMKLTFQDQERGKDII